MCCLLEDTCSYNQNEGSVSILPEILQLMTNFWLFCDLSFYGVDMFMSVELFPMKLFSC